MGRDGLGHEWVFVDEDFACEEIIAEMHLEGVALAFAPTPLLLHLLVTLFHLLIVEHIPAFV